LDSIGRLLAGEGVEALLRDAERGIEMSELVRLCGRPPERIALPSQARIVDAPGERFIFLEPHWLALCERAVGALRTFHAEQPDEPGIDRGRLRRMTVPALSDPAWRAVIDDLVQRRAVRRSGHWLHLPEHRITLGERELELAGTLCAALAAGGFDPPWIRDLARTAGLPDDEVRAVLRKCVVQGGVYQIVRDLYYHRDRVRELARVVKRLVGEHGAMDAAHFRDAIGVGRKRAIQILEFFDRVGYTRRTRNARVLRVDSSWHDEV
jgi:selenocysteine-specific elongation factor